MENSVALKSMPGLQSLCMSTDVKNINTTFIIKSCKCVDMNLVYVYYFQHENEMKLLWNKSYLDSWSFQAEISLVKSDQKWAASLTTDKLMTLLAYGIIL